MYSYLQDTTVLHILSRGYGFTGDQFRLSTFISPIQENILYQGTLSEKGVYFFFHKHA